MKYIDKNSRGEHLPAIGKADALIADGAKEVDGTKFQENLLCVVENPFFDAALYCDESSYEFVINNPDNRTKRWLVYSQAKQLAL